MDEAQKPEVISLRTYNKFMEDVCLELTPAPNAFSSLTPLL